MVLWLILGVMTAAAMCAVLWPLARHAGTLRSGTDVAVYRDQLDEVERDVAAGLIGPAEAQAARLEISRRLLAAADVAQAAPAAAAATSASRRRRVLAIAASLALPVVAGSLYLRLGSPQLAETSAVAQAAAQPAAAPGVAADQPSIEALVAKVEEHLQRNPNDGRGWEILAPVYMRLGRYTDAVNAWRKTLQLLGENADRDANLGEALTAQANGVVTVDAKAAFVRAATLDATNVTARYYLGLTAEQDGQRDKAAKIWRELIAQAPAGASWLPDVRAALASVEGKSLPGPSAAQMAAAAKEPPDQQEAMIQGMVDRLAARLKQDGSDVGGWIQLIRSYKVIGNSEKKKAAIADARRALAADPAKLQQLETALKPLGAENLAAAAPMPGPDAAQVAAAAKEPPDQQVAMIQEMVGRLAARLKQDGSDVAGWVQLVRSYGVLGEPDKAQAAIADARQALAADPGKLQQLDAALQQPDANNSGNNSAALNFTPRPDFAPAPDPAPMAAANPPADHQGATMQGMVDRLAQHLKVAGSDPNGWLTLVRSYETLGEKDKATAAIADARHALADDPDTLGQFNAALKSSNIAE